MMDLHIGLFCLLFAIVSSIVIYFIISVSRSKEDSFDEAKANRRKIMKQLHNDNHRLLNDRNQQKKSRKSLKNKGMVSENADIRKDKDHAPVEQLHQTVSSDPANFENSKIKEKQKSSKQDSLKINYQKPQLTNKDDTEIPQNVMKINSEKVEKDNKKKKNKEIDIVQKNPDELNIAANQQQQSNVKMIDNKMMTSDNKQTMTSSTTTTSNSKQQLLSAATSQQHQPSAKSSKKKRAEMILNQIQNDKEAISVNLLISLIKKAEISRSEIQILIDALLNKQQEDVSEWLNGRQDPIVKLKKQLNDNELSLKNEKELNISLQAKLKELRTELNNERITFRTVDEQLLNLQNELRTITSKLQTTYDEKLALNNSLQQLQHKFNDEQYLLKSKDELIVKYRLNEEKNDETVIALQKQISHLSAKLQENVTIIEEYQKVQSDLNVAYEGSQFKINELQNQMNMLEKSLIDAKNDIDKLVVNNKNLYEQNETLSNQLKNQCQEMNLLREKNESLVKINAENWENGFAYKNNQQNFAEIEARLEEKMQQTEQLLLEREFDRNKIQELNLTVTRLNESKLLLDKANNEIKSLKENLAHRNKEITLLKEELEVSKQRNNTLQSKNWKIAEALANAEQALKNKLNHEQNSNVTSEINVEIEKIHGTVVRIMKHLFPEISLKDKDNIEKWLSYLEDSITVKSINGSDRMKSPQELLMQNNHLEALVVRYKNIIVDTERILNQLQKNVEIEETKWKSKIQDLEHEIAILKSNSSGF